MDIEFDSPSNKATKDNVLARANYADSQISPGLKNLIDQVRSLYAEEILSISGDVSPEESDRILEEAVSQVRGSEEAYEVWDILFNSFGQE